MKISRNPLVSVRVITYNSASTIQETLDSIKAQTYPNIELIISDDCSKDNTVEICDKWLKQNLNRFIQIKLITAEKNTGVSANVNRAEMACDGEWIKGIAGDDLLMPDCVQTYVDYITEHPDVVYVFANGRCFGKDAEYVKMLASHFAPDFFSWEKQKQLEYLYLCGSPIFAGSAFYNRKRCIDMGFKNDERIPNYEDRPKWIRMIEQDIPHAYINKETIWYRISGSSISTTSAGSKVFNQSIALFDKYYRIPFVERYGKLSKWDIFRHKLENKKRLSENAFLKVICMGLRIIFGKEPEWTKGFSVTFAFWNNY